MVIWDNIEDDIFGARVNFADSCNGLRPSRGCKPQFGLSDRDNRIDKELCIKRRLQVLLHTRHTKLLYLTTWRCQYHLQFWRYTQVGAYPMIAISIRQSTSQLRYMAGVATCRRSSPFVAKHRSATAAQFLALPLLDPKILRAYRRLLRWGESQAYS
jgi:hypothetical protein